MLGHTLGALSSLGERLGRKKGNGGNNKRNKKNKDKNKKNILLPNKHGVRIKTFGTVQMYNLRTDPEERRDIADEEPEMREAIKVGRYYLLYQHVDTYLLIYSGADSGALLLALPPPRARGREGGRPQELGRLLRARLVRRHEHCRVDSLDISSVG